MSEHNSTLKTQNSELRALSEHWGRGLLSTDEALGWLLHCLVREFAAEAQPPSQLKTQNSKLKTPTEALGTLLHQLANTLDVLAGPHLDVWRVGDLWYWRWEDSGDLSVHGLRSLGEALTDAVEQRHPAAFPPPREET